MALQLSIDIKLRDLVSNALANMTKNLREAIKSSASSANSMDKLEQSENSLGKTTKSTTANLNSQANSTQKIASSSSTAGTAINSLRNTVLQLVAAYASFSAVKNIFSDVVDTVAKTQALNVRLQALTSSTYAYNETQQYLQATASRLSTDIFVLSDSYSKLLTLQNSGLLTTQQSRDILEGYSNAAALSGASTDQLRLSLYGLTQGLSAGTLRAEELNQMTEAMPGLMQRLDEASGQAAGGFRKMVLEGKVTSDMLRGTLITALDSYGNAAERMQDNVGSMLIRLSNEYTALKQNFEAPVSSLLTPIINNLITKIGEFKQYVADNQNSVKALGTTLAQLANGLISVGIWLAKAVLWIGEFIANNKELIITLGSLYLSMILVKVVLGVLGGLLGRFAAFVVTIQAMVTSLISVGAALQGVVLWATGATTIFGSLNVILGVTRGLFIALAATPLGIALLAVTAGFIGLSIALSSSNSELEETGKKTKATLEILQEFRDAIDEVKSLGGNSESAVQEIERVRAAVMAGNMAEKEGLAIVQQYIEAARTRAAEQEQLEQEIIGKKRQLNAKQAELAKQLAKQEQQIAKNNLQAMLNGQQQFSAGTIQAARLSAQERVALEKQVVDKIKDLQQSLANEQLSVADKIRNLKRRDMSESGKQADIELQINEKLAAARAALESGDGGQASKLANDVKSLATSLNDTDKAVGFLEASSTLVQDVIKTNIDQAQQFKTELDKQANIPLKIESDITQAESEIRRLQNQLAALKDKTITITAKTVEAKNGGGVVGFASGGRVPGIGNTDTVPAMLTPQEFVVRQSRSIMFRPLLELINYAPLPKVMATLGQHLNTGGIVMPRLQMPQIPTLKFAEGGAVPSVANTETVNFNWNINGNKGTIRTLMADKQELDRFAASLHEASRGLGNA